MNRSRGRKETLLAGSLGLRGGSDSSLCIEDEMVLRNMAQVILEECGYRGRNPPAGKEALNKFEQAREINLLLADMVMPEGISSTELAEQLLVGKTED